MLYSADLASFFFEFLIRAEILLSRHKGVPGFPCRAILGVLEEILVFRRNIHLCLSVYKLACEDSQLMMDVVTKCGPHYKDPKQRNKWTYCTRLGIYFSFSKNCFLFTPAHVVTVRDQVLNSGPYLSAWVGIGARAAKNWKAIISGFVQNYFFWNNRDPCSKKQTDMKFKTSLTCWYPDFRPKVHF